MRVGHHQMAYHPCSFGPPVLCLVHAEQADEPVEAGLQVGGVHAREPPQVSLEPRAQVVDHLHGVEVGGVGGVGLVGLRAALPVGDHAVVGALLVVHDGAALREVGAQGLLDPLRRRLAVAADHGDWVLGGVDGDRDAQLLLGEAALSGLAVALGEVRVVDVDLVDPHAIPEHDAVLVAAHRREHAVAPLEGGLVGDAAQLGRRVDRYVPRHELDEANPRREVLLPVFEDGPGEGGEALPAGPAAESLPPSWRLAVFGGRGPAPRTGRLRAIGGSGLVEGRVADLGAAPPGLDGSLQSRELVFGQRVDPIAGALGCLAHDMVVPSAQAPARPGRRQT